MRYTDYMAAMQRDDDSVGFPEILADYLQGIDDLKAAVAGMTPEQLLARPVPGKWSTIEVVAHLADSEIFFTDRIVRTLAMERPLLVSVDEKPYPGRLNFQGFDLAVELDLFGALRRHACRILHMQPDEAWLRVGVHSEMGLVNVRQMVLQTTRHLRHHLPFIAEKRAALGITAG